MIEITRAKEIDGSEWVNAEAFDAVLIALRNCVHYWPAALNDDLQARVWNEAREIVEQLPEIPKPDPRDSDHSRPGIFAYHNCYKCNHGEKPCVNGSPSRCDFPRARSD